MKEQNYLDNLVGVFGHPAAENPGVVIQEAAFRDLGLERWHFLTIDVDPGKLGDAILGLKAMKFRGINCTIPHKIEALKYIDKVAASAKLIGAVNTIINDDGVLTGENTDGQGFMIALENAGVAAKDKNVVVLGAGGAARAICVELALARARRLTIVNIPKDMALGESLVKILKDNTAVAVDYVPWVGKYNIPAGTDILVNATSIGLNPNVDDKPDIDYDSIAEGTYVQDVIPNPAFTPFLREADKRGLRWQSGMQMLVNQAALNITMWTGLKPDKDVMIKAFEEAMS
ncbi:MAG: shikimate dehydrogenase [Treponema sp. RIFOXYC1_FULL_61_9]|nr:MAG: shikimate dehydrogenase [Treponema sp. RIFOXYC1_FULL_61_9]